jgi:tetratricopeptide (TPR) repeat protein
MDLASALRSLDEAADPEQRLLDLTLDKIEQDDPDLRKLIPYAAVARRLDPDVVRALQPGASDDLFDRLAALSFVLERQDGAYVFHDDIRNALLGRWRADEIGTRELRAIHRLLAEFHRDRHDAAVTRARDVSAVAETLRAANSARLAQTASAAEDAIVGPLAETIHHACAFDLAFGFDIFEQYFELHQSELRLGPCRSLLITMRDELATHGEQPAKERLAQWLRYHDARVLHWLERTDEARAELEPLIEESQDDVALQLRSLAELALCHEDLLDLRAAAAAYERQLELTEGVEGATSARTSALLRFGSLRQQLDDLDGAIDCFYEAGRTAVAAGDNWSVVAANAQLTELYAAAGRDAEAIGRFISALDGVRTQYRGEIGLSSRVAFAGLRLFINRNAMLLDTLTCETGAYFATSIEDSWTVSQRVEEAGRLLSSGQLGRTEELLAELKSTRAETLPHSREMRDVLITEALLHEARGEVDAAVAAYGDVLELPNDGKMGRWGITAAYSNRGELLMQHGDVEQAREDLETAATAWQEIGHDRWDARIRLYLARLLIGERRFAAAQEAIDELADALSGAPDSYCELLNARAELAAAQGDWPGAFGYREAAVAVHRRFGADRAFGADLLELARAAARCGRWDEARDSAEEASTVFQAVAERDAYRPTPDIVRADRDNVRALAQSAAAGSAQAHSEARDLLDAAIARNPENALYRLNAGYAAMVVREWETAAEHFISATELEPELFRGSLITDRAVLCLVATADGARAQGRVAGAEKILRDARERAIAEGCMAAAAAATLRIGDLLASCGDADAAREAYTSARELADDLREAAAATARLGVLAVADDEAAAEQLLQAALDAQLERQRRNAYWALLADCSPVGRPYIEHPSLRKILLRLRSAPENGVAMTEYQSRLGVETPQEWTIKESLTMVAPDNAANVIASVESVDREMTTADYADTIVHGVTELPEYKELGFGPSPVFGERPGLMRRFSWRPEDGEPVTQIQAYLVEGGRAYLATATTSTDAFEEMQLQLEQMLAGLVVARSEPAAASQP